MAQISYLKRRSAVYYARMPVPLDLQEITGTAEKAKSLATRDPKEAKRRITPIVAAWQDEFEDMRRKREVTPGDMAHAVWDHYTDELAHDDQERSLRPTLADIDAAKQEALAKANRGEITDVLDATIDVIAMQHHAA